MAAEKPLVVSFTKDKETKNTIRFSEDGDENVIGTLYVAKRIAKDASTVKVSIVLS